MYEIRAYVYVKFSVLESNTRARKCKELLQVVWEGTWGKGAQEH